MTTKSKLPQYKNGHTEVIRRFRDFAWLWQRLQDTNRGTLAFTASQTALYSLAWPDSKFCSYAGIIVPPLPEKSTVQKFQMTSDFIEQRRRALQVFVNRVVSIAAAVQLTA